MEIQVAKKDYSSICNCDDEDMANPCWECTKFLFPIGCMAGEDEEDTNVRN